MNKNMVEMMQKDLHIFPYRDELSSYYAGRLVYSALGYWIRECIMDRTSESNDIKSKASHAACTGIRILSAQAKAFMVIIPSEGIQSIKM